MLVIGLQALLTGHGVHDDFVDALRLASITSLD